MIDIRDAANHLLMRYDPSSNTAEIQKRGVKTTVNLNQYKRSDMSAKIDAISDDRLVTMIKEELLKLFPGEPDMTIDDIPGIMCLTLIKGLISREIFYRINDPTRTHLDLVNNMPSATSATVKGGDDGRQPDA